MFPDDKWRQWGARQAPGFGEDQVVREVVRPVAEMVADKAASPRPGLPVLFTTRYTRNAIVHNGRLDSAVELLTKPYSQQALARRIRELLDRAHD